MKQRIEAAVSAIFENYEDTPQLQDFREEISMNLLERVRDLTKKGMDESEATGKALSELGDITEVADAIGKQKRQEAIGDYFFPKAPLDRKHAVGYSAAAALLVLGLVSVFLVSHQHVSLGQLLLVFLPFSLPSACGFVYLGLTQETRAHYPLRGKRAALFCLAAGLMFTGAVLGASILFQGTPLTEVTIQNLAWIKAESLSVHMLPSLLVLLLLILPGAGMLGYLVLTQEKRYKPWLVEQIRLSATVYGERFGLVCAAIWTFAFALFVLLGFLIGWHPAWIVFLFAIATQMLVMVFFAKK
jgi:4-hydroxybenzoate polyprenyltransferase